MPFLWSIILYYAMGLLVYSRRCTVQTGNSSYNEYYQCLLYAWILYVMWPAGFFCQMSTPSASILLGTLAGERTECVRSEYLRFPNARNFAINALKGFLGFLGSWDCQHCIETKAQSCELYSWRARNRNPLSSLKQQQVVNCGYRVHTLDRQAVWMASILENKISKTK